MPFAVGIVYRVRRAGCALALGALLAGCAGVRLPPLPKDELPPAWRNAEASNAPAPDLRGWWKGFNDPTLNALIDQALHDNLDVQQAALRLRAARALESVSAAQYQPQLGFRTLSLPTPEATANYFQAGFDAEWELPLFGRAQANRNVAAGDAGIAQAELQSARVSLVAEVARVYLRLRGAQAREWMLHDIADASQSKLHLVKVREHLRLASLMEVERAEAEDAQAQAALAEPRAQIAQAAQTLALLLGRNAPPADLLQTKAMPPLPPTAFGSVPADLLRTRPEIARAQAEVLKAAGELGLARADRFPRIGLGGAITWAARASGSNLGNTHHIAGIGPVIDIPLFDWGMRAAAEHARDDELKAALLAYRQAVLQGVAEVEIALAQLHQTHTGAAQLSHAVLDMLAAVEQTEQLRKLEQADDLDVADARIAAARAELDSEQASERADLAYIALYKALGGAPLPQDERSP